MIVLFKSSILTDGSVIYTADGWVLVLAFILLMTIVIGVTDVVRDIVTVICNRNVRVQPTVPPAPQRPKPDRGNVEDPTPRSKDGCNAVHFR